MEGKCYIEICSTYIKCRCRDFIVSNLPERIKRNEMEIWQVEWKMNTSFQFRVNGN